MADGPACAGPAAASALRCEGVEASLRRWRARAGGPWGAALGEGVESPRGDRRHTRALGPCGAAGLKGWNPPAACGGGACVGGAAGLKGWNPPTAWGGAWGGGAAGLKG
jgi:hypothetical protein